MKIGIMQPYIFPYLGYFQLINHTDTWVVFDNIQFSSKSWVNRNRVLHPEPEKGWQYFTIPLQKHALNTLINEITINQQIQWQSQLLGKLSHYKNKAPFYRKTIEFVKASTAYTSGNLSNLLVSSLANTCDYLGIDFRYELFSEMDFNNENISAPGDWALEIAKAKAAHEYVNPPSGYKIFNEQHFKDNNIKLSFLTSQLPAYPQKRAAFCAGLSIIDIMMWNSISDIKELLTHYDIHSYQELLTNENKLP